MDFLVEWFRPEVTELPLDDIVARLDDGAVSKAGTPVHLVMALAIPVDEIVWGVFASDSAHLVRDACMRAGMPAGRVTVVHQRQPPGIHGSESPTRLRR